METTEKSEMSPSRPLTPVQAEVVVKAELWAAITENNKHAWTLAIALFYLSGFLALNAHLTKSGIAEFDIVSTRYVLAAANFTLFLLVYAMFVLRSVTSIHDWITAASARVTQPGRAIGIWPLVVAFRSLVYPLFMHCFAAAFYSWIALGQSQFNGFQASLIGIFVATYFMETSGLSAKYPRACELLELVADLIGVIVFFSLFSGAVTTVFWIFLGLSAYINIALDIMSRRTRGASMYGFFAANSAVSILTLSLAFGAQLYAKVPQKIGGGMPYEVRVAVDERTREILSNIFPKKDELLHANLVYQTEKHLFLSREGQTFRIRNENVQVLAVTEAFATSAVATARNPLAPASSPQTDSQSANPTPAASR